MSVSFGPNIFLGPNFLGDSRDLIFLEMSYFWGTLYFSETELKEQGWAC